MATGGRIATAVVTLLALVLSTPGTSAVASPGDNGSLAITGPGAGGRSQSYSINPDGSGLRRLFAGQVESNYNPTWSPDGRWFAFNRFESLLVARADGSDTRVLDSAPVYRPSWSPDGTRLVYTLRPNGLTGQIWVINADGTDRHMIHHGPSVESPSWSPLGDKITFQQRRNSGPGEPVSDTDTEVFVMDADGGNVTQLTTNTDPEAPGLAVDGDPTWSPDGSRIVFYSSREGACAPTMPFCEGDLFLMNADGSDVTRLPAPGFEVDTSWSPDGSSLAYVTVPRVGPGFGAGQVTTRNLATGEIRTVHEAESPLATVDWGAAPGSMPRADLRASLAVADGMVAAGSATSYSATVTNGGDSTAVDSELTFRLPPGVTVSAAGISGCLGQDVVRCPLGDLPAGDSRSVTLTAAGGVAGVHEVSAMATSTTADPDFANNRQAAAAVLCTSLGTAADDTLLGTSGADVLCGVGGDDTLRGRGGQDVLLGGAGSDNIDGGKGKDTVSYALSRKKVSADLGAGRVDGEGKDRLKAVENAAGSRFADVLTGSSARNVLEGGGGRDRIRGLGGADRLRGGADADLLTPGAGNDELDGGLADDLVDYGDSPVRVLADLKRGRATAQGSDRLASVEGVRGSRFDDELIGSILGNRMIGGGGSDLVRGAGGNDRVKGGDGADELLGGDGDDRFSGGPGVDRCDQDYGRGKRRQCEKT
jgi:Ca2+-binding RTX toxin-like protein